MTEPHKHDVGSSPPKMQYDSIPLKLKAQKNELCIQSCQTRREGRVVITAVGYHGCYVLLLWFLSNLGLPDWW